MTYLPQLHRILVDAATRLDDSGRAEGRASRAGRFVAGMRRLRRQRLFVPVSLAILLAGSAAAAFAVVESQPSAPPSGTLTTPAGATHTGTPGAPNSYRITATPDLNGGAVGWCISDHTYYSQGYSGGGTCGDVQLPGQPIIGFDAGFSQSLLTPRSEINRKTPSILSYAALTDVVFVTTPQVAAVRVSPTLTIRTRADAQLPNRYRIAVSIHESITHVRRARGGARSRRPSYPNVPNTRTAVALDAAGHRIGGPPAPGPRPHDDAVFWQAQPTRGVGPQATIHAPPAGACEINTSGLTGVDLFFGSVVQHVHGFPQLTGKTYLACAETQFGYHGGVDAAILLDAQHPGAPPEPLPNATPVPGNTAIVNEPAADIGTGQALTARRLGNAWLVIETGGTITHRVRMLDRLHSCIKLNGTPCPSPN
jgi:hypothetical protein